MPELEVLCEYLGPLLAGEKIEKVTVSPKFGFLLRTPPADLARALEGPPIAGLWRRGEVRAPAAGDQQLVINPMLGGRLHWSGPASKPPPATILSADLAGG